jgi:hypothetical protein
MEVDCMEQRRTERLLDPDFDALRAGVAGAGAALVYLAVMVCDIRVTGSASDDLLLLGRPITADPRRARLLGLVAHTGFGCTMGLLYAAVLRRHLRGPSWLRGITMMLAENTVLWPLTPLVDRVHPSVRAGDLPPLNTLLPFLQQVDRHVAFGAAMGLIYGQGASKPRPE